jgi:hypothetical protein
MNGPWTPLQNVDAWMRHFSEATFFFQGSGPLVNILEQCRTVTVDAPLAPSTSWALPNECASRELIQATTPALYRHTLHHHGPPMGQARLERSCQFFRTVCLSTPATAGHATQHHSAITALARRGGRLQVHWRFRPQAQLDLATSKANQSLRPPVSAGVNVEQ